jgi:hypothetical protein
MEKEELKQNVINLLYDLHAFNLLNDRMVKLIGINLEVDAEELCRQEGITYDIIIGNPYKK